MKAADAIKEIRNIDCKEHCVGIAENIPHKGCQTCRCGAAIEALSIIAFDSMCISKDIMPLDAAIKEIRGEECKEQCFDKGLSISEERCSTCRWGVAIEALQFVLHAQTCAIIGTDMLGADLRINDSVAFASEGNPCTGIIQSVTKGGMLVINTLSGSFRRKGSSVKKINS